MPSGIRYISEVPEWVLAQIPSSGKYILDKSITGCGGTELFLNLNIPLVHISPRSGVLSNKSSQHPEAHLFRGDNKTDLKTLKDKLRGYLDNCGLNPFGIIKCPKILVTLDSAKYVIEELKNRHLINNFLFLVDEFQCLIGDAAFKGRVNLEFLRMIDTEAINICYMSATPIETVYLEALSEFKELSCYKLIWDPDVIIEPTIKTVLMKQGESAASIMRRVIERFRRDKFFAAKIQNDKVVYSTEVVVFVNEVKTILKIIRENALTPEETTVLISSGSKYAKEFQKAGYEIDQECADRNNPVNKTFTFCSKASFEGRDFYSTSAFTYIFIDGTKDWQVHDTAIEIPQILGRQRLDANPFKNNAMIFYRIKPEVESEEVFYKRLGEKMERSNQIINIYDAGDDTTKDSLAGLVEAKNPSQPYIKDYIDIVTNSDGKYRLEPNFLVAAAEHNLWACKRYLYSNPLHLTEDIRLHLSTGSGKSDALIKFETAFYKADSFKKKMKRYCSFRCNYPTLKDDILSNPFIGLEYHNYLLILGPDEIRRLKFNEELLNREYEFRIVKNECASRFSKGMEYTPQQVKSMLQVIYSDLKLGKIAKAKQLTDYIQADIIQKTDLGGKRRRFYRIA